MTPCPRFRPHRPTAPAVAVVLAGLLAPGVAPVPAQAAFLVEQAQGAAEATNADTPSIDSDEVVLRWLDKSTARVDQITVPVGETVALGGLSVTVRACRRTAPDQQPEHAAFLDIHDATEAPGSEPLFRGWMFASSPSLSAMEHPVYDVWVLACADASEDMGGTASTEETPSGAPLPPPLPPRRP